MSDSEKKTNVESMEPSVRTRRRRRLYLVWTGINLALVLFVVGFYLWSRPRSEEAAVADDPTEEIVQPTDRAVDPSQLISQGDLLLISDQPTQALELYRQARSSGPLVSEDLAYRTALAMELSGAFDESIELYQAMGSEQESGMAMLARLGYARTLFRSHRYAEAYEQLTRLAAIEAHPQLASQGIAADVDFLLGFACVANLRESFIASRGNVSRLSLHNPEPVPPDFAPTHLLNLIGATTRDILTETLTQPDLGCHVVHPSTDPDDMLLSLHFDHHQGIVILDSLAAVTSWKVEVTPQAKEILQGRRLRLMIKETTADHFLSLLLSSQGLIWDLQGDRLMIDVDDRVDRESLRTRHLALSRRLLQRALLKWPRHELVPATTLSLANLAYEQRQIDEAITTYQEATTRFDPSSVIHIAWFNLAKALYLKGDTPEAIEAFYHAVDERSGEEIESASYLFLGRIHLENGDLRQAQIDLSRCHSRATETEVVAHACMLLAASYLLSNKSGSAPTANELLMERRSIIDSDSYRTAGAFLSAYSRFRVAVTEREVLWRARDFTAASFHVRPGDFFGDIGYLLMSNAFVDLHLDDKLQQLCEEGIEKPIPSSIRNDLSLKLGKIYASQSDTLRAERILHELINQQELPWARQARLELATMYFDQEMMDKCLQECALGAKETEDHAVLGQYLKLMGRVFVQRGDHENAAICYAGGIPPVILETRIAEAER